MPLFPSTAFITSILNLIKNDTPFLALYTTNPGAGDTGTEVSGGSYARKAITFGTISGGQMSNTAAISFPNLPNANISHYGIRNALTGGTLKSFGTLSSVAAVINGDEVVIPVGGLVVSVTGS